MRKILPLTAFAVVAALIITTSALPLFAKEKGSGNGNAYGHIIAPGWLKKHEPPSTENVALPPGIDKKINDEDIVAPVISNIEVVPTDDDAVITWDTNESAKSTVYVSTTSPLEPSAVGVLTVVDTNLTTTHEVLFDGLTPSTTYYSFVTAVDSSGNTSTSSEFSFTTLTEEDTTDPILSNVVLSIGTSTARVDWSTDEPATSVAYLSTTTGFETTDAGVIELSDLGLVNDHSLTFVGLSTSTTYYLRIESVDVSTNGTLSDELTFTTSP